MESETLKVINNISKRLNEVERKLEQFLLNKQEVTNNGVADIANIISGHDEAIADLAVVVSEIAEKEV